MAMEQCEEETESQDVPAGDSPAKEGRGAAVVPFEVRALTSASSPRPAALLPSDFIAPRADFLAARGDCPHFRLRKWGLSPSCSSSVPSREARNRGGQSPRGQSPGQPPFGCGRRPRRGPPR